MTLKCQFVGNSGRLTAGHEIRSVVSPVRPLLSTPKESESRSCIIDEEVGGGLEGVACICLDRQS